MKKDELIKTRDGIFRVLTIDEQNILVIDCEKQTMPEWKPITDIMGKTVNVLPIDCITEEELSAKQKQVMHQRFTLIAPILAFVSDDEMRNKLISRIAVENNISRKTICNYLCKYLATDNITSLAPAERIIKKELTKDQKNMRWALNKFYYTRHGNTIPDAYIMMLKEKYCDDNKQLLEEHPSLSQFRYFYNKTRSKQTEIISREGMKKYMLNSKPLIGNGIREFASGVGMAMVDGTICDIYLVDDSGCLVGRPILLACVDAYSGMCLGYFLGWEGGVYSVKELLLNVIEEKTSWCKKFGITISKDQWNCSGFLPGEIISDRGSEYISFNYEQLTDLGVKCTSLPSFSANQKGQVEKLFSLIQDSFKPYLKGKGVIEPDFQQRGATDYRKKACLTIRQFEQIVLRCIIYHNDERLLENFPFSEEMLKAKVKPVASEIWNYARKQKNANLIRTNKQELTLTLFPRTTAKFTRHGLKVNKLFYRADGHVDDYLTGKTATVAYNPNNASYVYVVENDYEKFELIDSRFVEKSFEEIEMFRDEEKAHINSFNEGKVKAKVELAKHIETIANAGCYSNDIRVDGVRKARQKAKTERHKEIEEINNE